MEEMKIAKELPSGGRATQKKRDLPRRRTRGYPGEGAGEVDWREARKAAWEEEGGVTQEEVEPQLLDKEKPPGVGCCPYQLGLLGVSAHTCGKVLQLVANLWGEVPVLRALRAESRGWWVPE